MKEMDYKNVLHSCLQNLLKPNPHQLTVVSEYDTTLMLFKLCLNCTIFCPPVTSCELYTLTAR